MMHHTTNGPTQLLRIASSILLACSLFWIAAPFVAAQADSGRVVATVTDPTGAAISNATLTLANSANGSIRTAGSNGRGELDIEAVPVGNYSAKIEAPGFASQSVQFVITVTQAQTLTFKLVPGRCNLLGRGHNGSIPGQHLRPDSRHNRRIQADHRAAAKRPQLAQPRPAHPGRHPGHLYRERSGYGGPLR